MFYTGIILLSCTQAKCIKCSKSNSILFEVLDFYSRIFIFLKTSLLHCMFVHTSCGSHTTTRRVNSLLQSRARERIQGARPAGCLYKMRHLASSSYHFSIKHLRLKPPHFCLSHFCVGVVISVSLFL